MSTYDSSRTASNRGNTIVTYELLDHSGRIKLFDGFNISTAICIQLTNFSAIEEGKHYLELCQLALIVSALFFAWLVGPPIVLFAFPCPG